MIRYAVVGTGWRAEFFLRLAALMPDRFNVTGVMSRSIERADGVRDRFGCPAFTDLGDLMKSARPDFLVTCIPREINPGVIEAAVAESLPVLSETPPVADVAGLQTSHRRLGVAARSGGPG